MAFVVCRRAFFFGAIASKAKTNAAAEDVTNGLVCIHFALYGVSGCSSWGSRPMGVDHPGVDPGGGPRGGDGTQRKLREGPRKGTQGVNSGSEAKGTRDLRGRTEEGNSGAGT